MIKGGINELAVFGGQPAFSEKLYVGRPNIGNRQHLFDRINTILDKKWLSNDGDCVREFERRIAEITGAKHCIAVVNGTVGLELVVRALNLSDEVILPSFTFVATAHALQWLGLKPVFCDIEPNGYTIDPNQVETLITPRTSAIMGVHVWGGVCDVAALDEIAKRHGIKLIFDACHAFGCSYNGQMVGNFGDAEVFSFHATKFVNSFEGGAIVTNDDALAGKIRPMKNFGITGSGRVDFVGINGKMHEVSAAMGLTSLESMGVFVAANHRNHEVYRDALAGVPGLRLIGSRHNERQNRQYVVIEIEDPEETISRDLLHRVLKAEGVETRRYFYPACHNAEPYRSNDPTAGLALPVTERLMRKVLSLPTGVSVSEDDLRKVCGLIAFSMAHGLEITARLEAGPGR